MKHRLKFYGNVILNSKLHNPDNLLIKLKNINSEYTLDIIIGKPFDVETSCRDRNSTGEFENYYIILLDGWKFLFWDSEIDWDKTFKLWENIESGWK